MEFANKIMHENCLTGLARLPEQSVQCCVTSPPYYGLRDYGNAEQIGLEETPEVYVEKMVKVFREVWRVLKDDGTLWLNLGDSYANGKRGRDDNDANSSGIDRGNGKFKKLGNVGVIRTPTKGLKNKDLIGIPWRVALALQADGWYLRQDIIWHKPNPMPESVTDRCTKAHEYIFLLTKSPKYYYDNEAIKEPSKDAADDERRMVSQHDGNKRVPTKMMNGIRPRKSKKRGEFNGKTNALPGREAFRAIVGMANKRSVWTVTLKPYDGAHFATFPAELIVPCIKAGTKPGDQVVDPFFGTGTTGEVALRLGRKFVGFEINSEYIELANKRLAPHLNTLFTCAD